MPITQKEDGTYTADGHSWTVKGCYETINGQDCIIDYLFTIKGDRILEKVLKITKNKP